MFISGLTDVIQTVLAIFQWTTEKAFWFGSTIAQVEAALFGLLAIFVIFRFQGLRSEINDLKRIISEQIPFNQGLNITLLRRLRIKESPHTKSRSQYFKFVNYIETNGLNENEMSLKITADSFKVLRDYLPKIELMKKLNSFLEPIFVNYAFYHKQLSGVSKMVFDTENKKKIAEKTGLKIDEIREVYRRIGQLHNMIQMYLSIIHNQCRELIPLMEFDMQFGTVTTEHYEKLRRGAYGVYFEIEDVAKLRSKIQNDISYIDTLKKEAKPDLFSLYISVFYPLEDGSVLMDLLKQFKVAFRYNEFREYDDALRDYLSHYDRYFYLNDVITKSLKMSPPLFLSLGFLLAFATVYLTLVGPFSQLTFLSYGLLISFFVFLSIIVISIVQFIKPTAYPKNKDE